MVTQNKLSWCSRDVLILLNLVSRGSLTLASFSNGEEALSCYSRRHQTLVRRSQRLKMQLDQGLLSQRGKNVKTDADSAFVKAP